MQRHEVLNGLLALHRRPRYLEIGVCDGETFDRVRAARKVAVDPAFRFDHAARTDGEFHAVASDAYFGAITGPDDRFEVVFLDGLHTSEQTLRDLLNAIERLAPGGAIVIDDVRPASYAASLRSVEAAMEARPHAVGGDRDHAWMGDVYRVGFFVETFLQGWSFAAIAETHGQLALWRGRRAAAPDPAVTIEAVGRAELIDLYRALPRWTRPYAEVVAAVRASK